MKHLQLPIIFIALSLLLLPQGLLSSPTSKNLHHFTKQFPDTDSSFVYSVLHSAAEQMSKEGKVSLGDIYYFAGDNFFDNNEMNNAYKAYSQALIHYNHSVSYKRSGDCLINLGIILEISGNLNFSMYCYNEAYSNYQKINHLPGMANAANNIAILYSMQGRYEEGLKFFLLSLEIEQKLNNKQGISYSLNNLGLLSRKLGRMGEALNYYEESMNIKQQIEDIKGAAITMNNIGSLHEETDSLDKALTYFNGALDLNKRINNTEGIALGLHNIASVYQKQGKTTLAIENYYQALTLRKNLNHSQGLASSALGLAQCYLSMGQTTKALTHIQEGLDNSLKSGLYEISIQFYKAYSQYFSMNGNNEKALEYYIKYSNGKDSLTEVINHSKVTELQTRFETQQKELTITKQKRHIDTLSKDKEIKDLQIQRNRYIGISFFIIFILLILVTVGYYKRLKFRTMTNKTLEEKNLQLNSLMETRNKLFSIISHDMKNMAGVSESVSGMLHRKYDVMSEDMRKNNARIAFETARQNKQLIDNLLQWTLTQGEKIHVQKESTNATEATEFVLKELAEMAQTKGISFDTQYKTSPEVWCDRNMLTTVLRNLIANAIKFSHSESIIKITISQNKEEALFSIEDSGIGMNESEVSKLFRNDTNPKEIGNHKEKGTGFGLMICKEFVQINKGRIFAQSVAGKGSTFSFTIPLYDAQTKE